MVIYVRSTCKAELRLLCTEGLEVEDGPRYELTLAVDLDLPLSHAASLVLLASLMCLFNNIRVSYAAKTT